MVWGAGPFQLPAAQFVICFGLHHDFVSRLRGFRAKAEDFRRIWLFTNDDSPLKGDAAEQRSAVQKAKDCSEVGEEILLYCLPSLTGTEFNVNTFWRNIVSADVEDEDGNPVDNVVHMTPDGTFENLMERIRIKAYQKRMVWN